MSEPGDELREIIAVEHGLDRESAKFLVGTTAMEIAESATVLARLLEDRREQDPEPENCLDAAAAAQLERKRSLELMLTAQAPRRDERGRFAPGASGGFDGGARPAAPTRRESHDEILTRLLRTGEGNVGGHI